MRMRRIPLAIKVPAVVLGFMAMVAFFVSERVLSRLSSAQTHHLEDLASVHLDGLATALIDPVVRDDIWEIFDILDRARQSHAGLKPTATVVAAPDGEILASSDPRALPSRSKLPAGFLTQATAVPALAIRYDEGQAVARRDLASGGQVLGSVHAAFDIAPLLAERRSVFWTLLTTNAALTVALAVLAWLTVRRMMRPVGILAAHLRAGAVEPISPDEMRHARGEFRPLFGAFNGMVEAVREREGLARQLAEEERLASLGRLASGMAHEINNPLGGILNAIDTLKQHGGRHEVRTRTLDLIERGLKGIRDVVRTTLVTYRADRDATRSLHPDDVDDLKLLIGPEVSRKNITLTWSNGQYGAVPIPASVVRQVVLNLLLNAVHAAPICGAISLEANVEGSCFNIVIGDDGPGLSDIARQVLEGGVPEMPPTSATGSGLGLWMVRRLLKEVGGSVSISPREPAGTSILVSIPFAHQEALADVA
jgi:two-component system, OmpR family, sensor kinase